MKLTQIRLSNFQSFGPEGTLIVMSAMTYLLGPNGTGKTAILQALTRLFGVDSRMRRISKSDFHVATAELVGGAAAATLWIEAQFEFPELKKPKGKDPAVPGHFAHMRLESADGLPRVRFRLTAQIDEDGDIEESMVYVLQVDAEGNPTKTAGVSKHDRNSIQVHYLPARRDPSDHVSYAANSLLGRTLRAADWQAERKTVTQLTGAIGEALAGNAAIQGVSTRLSTIWSSLHKGAFYASPSLSFEGSEIDNLLRHLTVSFTPGHTEALVDFSRLSDGQQSLLYLSLVLSLQAIGREVLADKLPAFDIDKLRPAVFTLVAMEEPENSLSPHYLGRVIKVLTTFAADTDSQAVVATHAPSLLRRVEPESIRYLRLDTERRTVVTTILMPAVADEAHKFVREAIQAFPELYFSRLVILGEGDSEEIVLPRLLQACGLAADETSISVVPLGGRHVNHFWRLLHGLGIPQVTLLDLDLARHQGGWGRIKYAIEQLLKFPTIESNLAATHLVGFPKWNDHDQLPTSKNGPGWISFLESAGVFFSSPLDLDFLMMREFPKAYGVGKAELIAPDAATISAVLGKSHGDAAQYSAEDQKYFDGYHRRFKLGSKPAAHLAALANLSDTELELDAPPVLDRLIKLVADKLKGLPE